MEAAKALSKEGVEAEVIDLRTLVPPIWIRSLRALVERAVWWSPQKIVLSLDSSAVFKGRLSIDFQGFPRVPLARKNIPGIAQCLKLENATILTAADIREVAVEEVRAVETDGGPGGWSWIPPRHFLN